MNKINEFRGKYFFLSNFYEVDITYDGITYTNNESAFQSMKCKDKHKRLAFAHLEPSKAKAKGRKVLLRNDWEDVKEKFMYEICLAKFQQNPVLKSKLLATGDTYLEEGNTWGDREWGTVCGKGKNKLGKILMKIREELK